jgi:hypothetical protein
LDDGIGAGRLLSLMRAGLEGDHHGRPSSPFSRTGECHGFGVPVAEFRMPPLTHQFTIAENYCPYQRVRLDPPPTSPSEIQGAGHRLPLIHSALEAHSQAKAGEELPFRSIEILEVGG